MSIPAAPVTVPERVRALRQIEARPVQRRSQATNELADRLRSEIGQDMITKEGKL